MEWTQDYSLNNTYDLIKHIENIDIPDNSIFVSFDISNMYSNVPIKKTLDILRSELSENINMNQNRIDDIMNLTEATVNQNYFQFNEKYYKQEEGLAMGSPLSGLLSNIFMHDLESNVILTNNNPFKSKIVY